MASPARSNSLETNASFGAIELKLFLCCSYFCRTRKQSALTSKMCTCARKVIIPSPPQPTPLWSPANNNDLGYIYIYIYYVAIYIYKNCVFSTIFKLYASRFLQRCQVYWECSRVHASHSYQVVPASHCQGFQSTSSYNKRHECIFPRLISFNSCNTCRKSCCFVWLTKFVEIQPYKKLHKILGFL